MHTYRCVERSLKSDQPRLVVFVCRCGSLGGRRGEPSHTSCLDEEVAGGETPSLLMKTVRCGKSCEWILTSADPGRGSVLIKTEHIWTTKHRGYVFAVKCSTRKVNNYLQYLPTKPLCKNCCILNISQSPCFTY